MAPGASQAIIITHNFTDHVVVPHPRYLIPYDGIETNLACTYACSGITAYSALQKIGDISGDPVHERLAGSLVAVREAMKLPKRIVRVVAQPP